jgi:adenine-specific DNA-methyltransferase
MATGISTGKWKGEKIIPYAETLGSIELQYAGKQSTESILASPAAQTELKEVVGASTGENRIYFGENLAVMAGLLKDPSVCGKVQLFYIDPPYATQAVYHSRSEKAAYIDLLRGPDYIEFLRARLILIRELLSDEGSLYLHLDENMAFFAKIVCDEVFGRKNFRNWITRKKCNTKNFTKHQYGNISDYILFYSKTDQYIWNQPRKTWDADAIVREYSYIDKDGRRFKKVPVHAPGERNGETGKPWRGKSPPKGKHWQYAPSTLDEMDKRGEMFWSKNGNPRRKIFFDVQSAGIPLQDIWMDFKDAHNQNIKITGYPTEKNFDMLKVIVAASSTASGLVADCFMGSGTTLEAAEELGRNWIGIDNSEEALAVTKRRLLHGRQPMGDFVGAPSPQLEMDVGTESKVKFRVFVTK